MPHRPARPAHSDLLADLEWRGLLYQQTDGAADALASPLSGYCGFDPTSDSLHVGSLVPMMGLLHLARTGHRPVALIGSGTALIGDPSGKTGERPLADPDLIRSNASAIRSQLAGFFERGGVASPVFDDNAQWLLGLPAVEFMRDIGKHFTVNYMLAKESVQDRMAAGISYTEFSYMLLQAYDFLELYRRRDVRLQIGGSDQWGNITAGLELIRRVAGGEAHGVTFPLVTGASGTKFGKTEAGNVWLDSHKTSPYQFYQFWINADDRDASRYLRMFMLAGREETESLERSLKENPERREAQRALAFDVTARVHGSDAAKTAEAVSGVLFGGGDPSRLDASALDALAAEIPATTLSGDDLGVGDVFVAAALVPSKSRARTLLAQGGAYLNGKRADASTTLADIPLLPGRRILLRKGARDYALVTLG